MHLKKILEEMTGDKENIRNALSEIKWMLTTPIKPAPISDDQNSYNKVGGNGNHPSTDNTNTSGTNDWPNNNEKRPKEDEIDLPTYIVRSVFSHYLKIYLIFKTRNN